MKQSLATIKLSLAAPAKASVVAASTGDFIIDPWLGIIGLGVLIVTGAIAVIREIRIEDKENNS